MRIFPVLILAVLAACRGEVEHSFAAHWQALPAELHGEVQGMPGHWAPVGTGGAVSTANALASQAGIEILRRGGNAVDAAIAIQWVLAVVEPQSSGLGGGGFMLVFKAATQTAHALDAREELPAAAPENLFLDVTGKALPFSERIRGARAVGVPGTVALMQYAHRRFGSGKISFAETLDRAIQLAESGIRVSPRLSQAMSLNRDRLIEQNGRNPYLKGEKAYAIGEILYQSDLADTLRLIAREGSAVFYTGKIARDIVATTSTSRHYASQLSLEDLAAYRVVERPTEKAVANGAKLYSISAPASGATVLKVLKEAAPFATSTTAEALLRKLLRFEKSAFAERERNLQDPDFVGGRRPGSEIKEAQNTSHISVIDAEGNAVSYTTSVETSMGSALFVRGRGFVLNNQLSDFAAEPRVVNAVEPGRRDRVTALNDEARETKGSKRPKSSMAPVIIVGRDGSLTALGSPGGPTIIGANVSVAAQVLAGVELQQAVNAPRALMMPHGKALVELPLRRNQKFLQSLKAAGIEADLRRRVISLGSVQAVQFDAGSKRFTAASDLRREGLGLIVTPEAD
ncbi:gamma-glutamyltransferase family protein [Turneriella parva]|uniref:Gamma-glutamyltransferase 1 n=1 Tax=Turneriella parva (strain ATCC BAA-1111 / DSM 21527 / NCTC 11395 / H) TaxID=869212 RepID=I4B857_TURPD|nr:gamma-glutamyltransferase family protein [Turneriella parva]AFM13464.1 gamma-glutamyltransferase 1 [Turneriella parva DSM 21527]